jgi:GT2 family glycosyltransferase
MELPMKRPEEELTGHCSRPDGQTDWLEAAIRRRESRIADMEAELAGVRRELEAVHASMSWRVTSPLRRISSRAPAFAGVAQSILRLAYWTVTLRLPSRLRAERTRRELTQRVDRTRRAHTYERWIALYDTLTPEDREGMRAFAAELPSSPLISILMPVFDPPERFLRAAIESVLDQVYSNWELCIADDASTQVYVRRVLEEYAEGDDRIRVVSREANGGISAASNSALDLAQGGLIGFLDHDDLLRPHALLLAARAFAADERIAFVYSDDDQIDEGGRRFSHNFKPEWDPTLLLSQNYVSHFAVFRSELVRHHGGLRSEYDGSQDWDLALRVTSRLQPEEIAHIPHVLYHWRAIPGSAALDISEKPYAIEAARRATAAHLRRTGQRGYIVPVDTHQDVRYALGDPVPTVTAIIPSTGKPAILAECIETLLKTDYPKLDIVVAVSEGSLTEPDRQSYLESLDRQGAIRMATYPERDFNYAWVVNWAARQADGELLLLLNDDVRGTREDWLEIMVGHVMQDGVAATGALLLYGDNTIQHAGMLLGNGKAEHLYRGRHLGVPGYINRARLPRSAPAVTAACMVVRRDVFEEVGRMDERLEVAYNDVDLCLKLRQAGWRVVFVPGAVLYHDESSSFGSLSASREEEYEAERLHVYERWGQAMEDDPFHNPNLALDASYPSRLAFPPRVDYPWRTHSSDREN